MRATEDIKQSRRVAMQWVTLLVVCRYLYHPPENPLVFTAPIWFCDVMDVLGMLAAFVWIMLLLMEFLINHGSDR